MLDSAKQRVGNTNIHHSRRILNTLQQGYAYTYITTPKVINIHKYIEREKEANESCNCCY